jgi:hypothetical protein
VNAVSRAKANARSAFFTRLYPFKSRAEEAVTQIQRLGGFGRGGDALVDASHGNSWMQLALSVATLAA